MQCSVLYINNRIVVENKVELNLNEKDLQGGLNQTPVKSIPFPPPIL